MRRHLDALIACAVLTMAAAPPPATHGRADLDPDNDAVVAPPKPVPDCEQRLAEAGVTFRPAKLPLRQKRRDVFTCGAHQAVVYLAGPGSARFSPRPVVTCQMALSLALLEGRLQQLAHQHLGARVVRIEQLGTYACRTMSAYPTMVSEHSYGNAIDLSALVLADGRRVSVARHFGATGASPTTREARFLRAFARTLYDEDIFSVVLTPFFDAHHRDHFHLDLARYRVDGARP